MGRRGAPATPGRKCSQATRSPSHRISRRQGIAHCSRGHQRSGATAQVVAGYRMVYSPMISQLPEISIPKNEEVGCDRHHDSTPAGPAQEREGWKRWRGNKNGFNRRFICSVAQDRHDQILWLFGGVFEVLGRSWSRAEASIAAPKPDARAPRALVDAHRSGRPITVRSSSPTGAGRPMFCCRPRPMRRLPKSAAS